MGEGLSDRRRGLERIQIPQVNRGTGIELAGRMSDRNDALRAGFDPATYSNACRGKVPFTSKKQAKGALRVFSAKVGDYRMVVYRCGACRYLHIGHPPRNSRHGD